MLELTTFMDGFEPLGRPPYIIGLTGGCNETPQNVSQTVIVKEQVFVTLPPHTLYKLLLQSSTSSSIKLRATHLPPPSREILFSGLFVTQFQIQLQFELRLTVCRYFRLCLKRLKLEESEINFSFYRISRYL